MNRIIFGLGLIGICLSILASDLKPIIQACASCHGETGTSLNSAWPNLAGQKTGYLKAQITAFRDGKRNNPQMQPFVKNLSDETIAQLASHYAAQPVAAKKTAPLNQTGRAASAYCISCHGKQGKSVNEEWPNIAGQQRAYLETQLLAFRDDSRTSPLMQVIAKELSKAQISDVAEFYSQIDP